MAHNNHRTHSQPTPDDPANVAQGNAHEHDRDVHHEGHTIVPMRVLVMTLVLLMFFTGLTVAAAHAEELFARAFNVHIPGWVNAIVALSIAAVKSIIVAAYFMQLRYDHNPMNALIAVNTILVLTFFLGFTMIDLGTRDSIYDYKYEPIVAGGVGGVSVPTGRKVLNPDTNKLEPERLFIKDGMSIAAFARERADRQIDDAVGNSDMPLIEKHAVLARLWNRYTELKDLREHGEITKDQAEMYGRMHAYIEKHAHHFEEFEHAAGHAHGHGEAPITRSSADASRVKTGLTLEELTGKGHEGEHVPDSPHGAEPSKNPHGEKPAGH